MSVCFLVKTVDVLSTSLCSRPDTPDPVDPNSEIEILECLYKTIKDQGTIIFGHFLSLELETEVIKPPHL